MELPKPRSAELAALITNAENRIIYEFLYDRRDNPPTMVEVENHVAGFYSEQHAQTQRRLRGLRDVYRLDVKTQYVKGRGYVYHLIGFKDQSKGKSKGRQSTSLRVRAQVLLRDGSRCAMCGKSPKEDGIKLVIDHKIPLDWGEQEDPNNPDNLQPLCTDCNAGKQAHYSAFDEYADAIREARKGADPWTRIGDLLKWLQDREVPRSLITIVAGEQNAGDDLKRLRELRYILGWDIRNSQNRNDGKRTESFYKCVSWSEYPPEGAKAAVQKYEQQRRLKKKALVRTGK